MTLGKGFEDVAVGIIHWPFGCVRGTKVSVNLQILFLDLLEETAFSGHVVVFMIIVYFWLICSWKCTAHTLRAIFLSKSSDSSSFHSSINTPRLSGNIHLISMIVEEINTLRHIALNAFTPFWLLAHWKGFINRGMYLRTIVNSSLLVWMRLHLLVIDALLLRKLCLIEASFSI